MADGKNLKRDSWALATAGLDLVGRDGRSCHKGIEYGGIEIGPVRPEDWSKVRLHAKFSEPVQLFDLSKVAFKADDGRKIELSDYSIFEPETDSVAFQRYGFDDIFQYDLTPAA